MVKTDKTLKEVKELFKAGKLKSFSVCEYTKKVSYILKEETKPEAVEVPDFSKAADSVVLKNFLDEE